MARKILPAALALALSALPLGAQEEEDGGTFLERQIESRLSGEGRNVTVTGFEGVLSGEARVAEITIADSEGIWLTIRDAVLDWNRAALLRGRLSVNELTAAEILVPRPPVSEGADAPSPEASGFSLPELPVAIRIDRVAAERVVLGPELANLDAVVSLEGSVRLEDGEGEAVLDISRQDDREGEFTLDASYANDSEVLAVDLLVDEGPAGIVARLLNIPDQPALRLAVAGEGPIDAFAADIQLATAGVDRLTGRVATAVTEDEARSFEVTLAGDVAPVFAPAYQPFFGPDVSLALAGRTHADGRTSIETLDVDARALRLSGQVEIGADGLPDLINLSGAVEGQDGGPVVLPLTGDVTRVDGITLEASFDAAEGERWTAAIGIDGLSRGGVAAERITLDGTGRIAGGPGDMAVTADLEFDALALDLADPEAGEALGERVTGAGRVTWSTGQPVAVENLDLDGETWGATLNAALVPEPPLRLVAEADIRAEDLAAFSGLAGRDLAGRLTAQASAEAALLEGGFGLRLTATGSDLAVDEPRADALLAGETAIRLVAERNGEGTFVETLEIANPQVTVTGGAQLTSTLSEATLEARIADAGLLGEGLEGPATATVGLVRAVGPWTWAVDLEAAGATLDATGTADDLMSTPLVTAEGRLATGDLAAFSDLVGRALTGSVDLVLDARLRSDLSEFDISAEGSAEALSVAGIEGLEEALSGQIDVALDAARAGDTAEAERILVSGPDFRIEGTASATGLDGDDPEVTLDATVRADDLSRFAGLARRPLSGRVALDIDGTANRSLTILRGAASGTVADVTLGLPDIDPLLAGETSIDVAGVRTGGSATLERLQIAGPVASLSASGRADGLGDAPVLEGTAKAEIPDLAPFSGLAGRDLGGSARVSAEGRGALDLASFDVSAEGRLTDIVTGIAEADRLLAGATTFDVAANRAGEEIVLERARVTGEILSLAARGRTGGGSSAVDADISISDASAVLAGLPGEIVVTLDAEETAGTWSYDIAGDASGIDIDATGTVEDLDTVPVIETDAALSVARLAPFSELAGRPLRGAVALDLSGRVSQDLSVLDITADGSTTDLALGIAQVDQILDGRTVIAVTARRDGEAIDLPRLSIDNPDIRLSASGALAEAGSEVTFDARLANMGVFLSDFSGPVGLNGTIAQRDAETLALDVTGTGPAGISITADGTIRPAGPTANLSVRGQLPLSIADAFIDPRRLAGTARVDLRVNGPLALSSVSGRVTAEGARLVDPGLGIGIENIGATVQLQGARATLDVGGRLSEGGQLRVSGPITLAAPFDAGLDIAIRNAVLTDPALYETSVSGDLGIDGPLTGGAAITGRLTLGTTEIRVPSGSLSNAQPLRNIRHIGASAGVRRTLDRAGLAERPETAGSRGGSRPFPLDIRVVAPNQIFVRGRGLDAELGGRLRLTGTTADIVPVGSFQLVRGRLDILGSRFTLDEGSVALQGDFAPVIRLVAQTEEADTTIFVIVEGSVTDPQIRFESEPQLPDDEVISRLLFGRGLENLSALQAAQLAAAVQTLRGGDGGVLGRIREGSGLADLDVTSDEAGNTAVRAGAYITDKIYTDVTVDSEGEAQLDLNFDINRDVTVKGSVSNAGETGIGIFYERDY